MASKAELVKVDETIRIPLSATEYKILSYFVDNANSPIYLENLAQYVWGARYDEKDTSSLKPHISKLRKKLNQIRDGLSDCIDTNYGFNSYTLKIEKNEHQSNDNTNLTSVHDSVCEDPCTTSTVRYATYFDLRKLGYTSLKIAEKLVENDKKLYSGIGAKKDLLAENAGTSQQWADYLSSTPESFQYFINDKNEIVGNFSLVSITEEQERAFYDGELSESLFVSSDTRDLFCAADTHILFLLNLSLNEEYATQHNTTLLRKAFLNQLASFAENDVRFKKIIVNVFKSSHEAFYKQWGFTFVKEHKASGRIYKLDLQPYPQALYTQLNKNSHFKEINDKLKALYDN